VEHWDVVVVGGGPAGAACAAAARQADPDARVLVLDRAGFPRDKVCGDAIAAETFDVLAGLGLDAAALTDGVPAVPRLRLHSPGGGTSERPLPRPAVVVPREVFDDRLLTAALATGAQLRRHHVRRVEPGPDGVVVDGELLAGVLVGADGAESVVRRAVGARPNPPDALAVAIRGYAPEPAGQAGTLVMATTRQRWPAYAWSFPIGDGRVNVGYGELVSGGANRQGLLDGLQRLLPEVAATGLRAHRLPLSTVRPRPAEGRVLLAGDAASLVNPLTGEGIYYAVLSGALAGRAAVGAGPAAGYRRALGARLGTHLRGAALASRLSRWPRLMDATVRAAAADQRVFDQMCDLGLADGTLTLRTLAAAARRLPG
jgi:geranylgeranyl reductase family protein